MPNEMQSDDELIERLTQQVEGLTEQRDLLQMQVSELQESLVQSESQNTRLENIIEASAEDLQLFGTAWIKPLSVQTITYQSEGGIHIDGVSIDSHGPPTADIAKQMESFAEAINTLNAERRAKARKKSSRTREN